jgi:glutamate 5-kinase
MTEKVLEVKEQAGALIARARRITVKVGSSLLVEPQGVGLRREWLAKLAYDLQELKKDGRELLVVSSGAVALGREYLGLKRSPRLDLKQAAAAAGQPLLMQAWEREMARFGIPTGQLLLTVEDTESRRRWLNARATLAVLLGSGALPIINENDSVATEELRYGDNDRLSARVALMVKSDLLIILSDVDGLYTGDPAKDRQARHVAHLDRIDEEVEAWAGAPSAAGIGSGGMKTKVAAARMASAFGCATIIASGREEHPLRRLIQGEGKATVVAASGTPGRAYKNWIAGTLMPAGSVTIDDGAVQALGAGRSLLPAGVCEVSGTFERGVCLRVLDRAGREVARGISAYTSAEAQAIQGCSRDEIAERLGYSGQTEMIHRDDMVLM